MIGTSRWIITIQECSGNCCPQGGVSLLHYARCERAGIYIGTLETLDIGHTVYRPLRTLNARPDAISSYQWQRLATTLCLLFASLLAGETAKWKIGRNHTPTDSLWLVKYHLFLRPALWRKQRSEEGKVGGGVEKKRSRAMFVQSYMYMMHSKVLSCSIDCQHCITSCSSFKIIICCPLSLTNHPLPPPCPHPSALHGVTWSDPQGPRIDHHSMKRGPRTAINAVKHEIDLDWN